MNVTPEQITGLNINHAGRTFTNGVLIPINEDTVKLIKEIRKPVKTGKLDENIEYELHIIEKIYRLIVGNKIYNLNLN